MFFSQREKEKFFAVKKDLSHKSKKNLKEKKLFEEKKESGNICRVFVHELQRKHRHTTKKEVCGAVEPMFSAAFLGGDCEKSKETKGEGNGQIFFCFSKGDWEKSEN